MAGSRGPMDRPVNGREREVRFTTRGPTASLAEAGDVAWSARVRAIRATGLVGDDPVRAHEHSFDWAAGEHHAARDGLASQGGLSAPMPGLVLKVLVRPGDKVRAHQTLIVLEAMKMEHNIEAPYDGYGEGGQLRRRRPGGRGRRSDRARSRRHPNEVPGARDDHGGWPAGRPAERGADPTAGTEDGANRPAVATGLTRIEAASFVSPKAIPQMANAAEVMAGIERVPGVTYIGLVPNERGARDAIAAGVDEISVVVSASESHNRSNVNRTIDESLRRSRE